MYIVNAKKKHLVPFFKSDSRSERALVLLRKVPQKCYFMGVFCTFYILYLFMCHFKMCFKFMIKISNVFYLKEWKTVVVE